MNLISVTAIIISIIAFLISISCHEFAHGYVAYLLGDPTAKNAGRLTLNPIKHFDLISIIFFLVFRFGWAKGVPINPNYFKEKKTGMVFTALAGPFTNILLAFIASVALSFFPERTSATGAAYYILVFSHYFFQYMLSVNTMLAIFNLIPIPPLDGSKVFFSVLPDRVYYKILSYDRFMLPILLILVYTGILDKIIMTGANNLAEILGNFAHVITSL